MSSDQSWMSCRFDGKGGLSHEYKSCVDDFIKFVQRSKDLNDNILCPFNHCKNSSRRTEDEVKVHLYQ